MVVVMATVVMVVGQDQDDEDADGGGGVGVGVSDHICNVPLIVTIHLGYPSILEYFCL